MGKLNGVRTLLLNLVAIIAIVAVNYLLDPMNGLAALVNNPIALAIIIGGLNIAKRYLAPSIVISQSPL